jgi:hypothetical protein
MSDLPLPVAVRALIDELYAAANLTNKKKIDLLARTISATMVPNKGGGAMRVESMVSLQSKNPVVVFKWGREKGELSPVMARGYALQILEAAEGAVQDASLYRAVMDTRGKESPEEGEKMAFALINMVRDNRRSVEEAAEEEDKPNA